MCHPSRGHMHISPHPKGVTAGHLGRRETNELGKVRQSAKREAELCTYLAGAESLGYNWSDEAVRKVARAMPPSLPPDTPFYRLLRRARLARHPAGAPELRPARLLGVPYPCQNDLGAPAR